MINKKGILGLTLIIAISGSMIINTVRATENSSRKIVVFKGAL